jgi:hypothetical protein
MDRIKLDQEELNTIKEILEENSGEKMKVIYDKIKEGLWYRCNYETELYIVSYLPKSLVIKRIELSHERKGDGTKIINFLTKYAIKHGYEKLIVECVSTKAMDSLCKKLYFQPDIYTGEYMDDIFFGNYFLPLTGGTIHG